MNNTLKTIAAILLWTFLAVLAAVGLAILDVIFNG